jgi:hypothetical protein
MAADSPPQPPSQSEGGAPVAEDAASQLEGGSYDVIRKRLLDVAGALGKKAEELNERRIKTFGGSQISLLATERVRTENNCVPRDIKAVSGHLLFGYNVFLGLKTDTHVGDVFSVHGFTPKEGGFDFATLPIEPGHYLADPTFVREFSDLYRYNKETKLLMVRTTDTRLLAIFQVGSRAAEQRVFRWGIDKSGQLKFIDARGEEDNVLPRQHDFEFTAVRREDQVSGDNPHFNIADEVFVETIGGDLTIKIENNTKDGKGIYREPVEDPTSRSRASARSSSSRSSRTAKRATATSSTTRAPRRWFASTPSGSLATRCPRTKGSSFPVGTTCEPATTRSSMARPRGWSFAGSSRRPTGKTCSTCTTASKTARTCSCPTT